MPDRHRACPGRSAGLCKNSRGPGKILHARAPATPLLAKAQPLVARLLLARGDEVVPFDIPEGSAATHLIQETQREGSSPGI